MTRIHTPASDSRHSDSDAPAMAGMSRNIRWSCTAARCRVRKPSRSSPHSPKSQLTSVVSDDSGTFHSIAATGRNAVV